MMILPNLVMSYGDVTLTIPLPSTLLSVLAAFEALAGSVMTVVGTWIGVVQLFQQLTISLRGRKRSRETET